MSVRNRRPKLPDVYLDQWLLSEAFDDRDGASNSLREWVVSLSGRANMFLSIAHVMECARWGIGRSDDRGARMASWLESLPYTWIRWDEAVRTAEVARVLARLDGRTNPAAVRFWCDTAEEAGDAEAIRSGGFERVPRVFPRLVQAMRSGAALQLEAEAAEAATRKLYTDRLRARDEEMPVDQREAIFVAIRRAKTAQLARAALRGLRFFDPAAHVPLRPELEARVAAFVSAVEDDDRLLPTFAVTTSFWSGHARSLEARSAKVEKVVGEHRSIQRDSFHVAVAGAYVDVFTCDDDVAGHLASIRGRLGLAPPISGGVCSSGVSLVDRLEASLTHASVRAHAR